MDSRCLFNRIMPASPSSIPINSAWCHAHRASGYLAFKEITINPGGAGAQTYNLFSFTGAIELKGIYGRFTDVTNVVTLTACSWDVNDGAATVALTAAAGTNCSGVALTTMVIKDATAVSALTLMNADQVRIDEVASSNRTTQDVFLNGKNATTNYLRWKCTTDANTNCKINFVAIWVCRYAGSTFAAV